jgi:hypothetical protein
MQQPLPTLSLPRRRTVLCASPRFLDDQGYYVSNHGFKGPFLASADLQAKKPVELKTINLFCVKKTLHDAVVKAYGSYGAWPRDGAGVGRRALMTGAETSPGLLSSVRTAPAAAAAAVWTRWLESGGGAQ